MVFGRKRGRPPAEVPELPPEDTDIVNAKAQFNNEPPKEEQKREIPAHIKEPLTKLMTYQGVYANTDFPNPSVEVCNLIFALYAEMLKLHETISTDNEALLLQMKELEQTIKNLA